MIPRPILILTLVSALAAACSQSSTSAIGRRRQAPGTDTGWRRGRDAGARDGCAAGAEIS